MLQEITTPMRCEYTCFVGNDSLFDAYPAL